MANNILELQERLYGGLHDHHTQRTANIFEAIHEEFGKEVLDILERTGVDKYGLYRWHLVRTLSIIGTLKEVYGPALVDVVLKREAFTRREEGK